MAYNIPSGETTRLSFGPGVLYLGASGTTPSVDVGYARGATMTITRDVIELWQGSPQELIKRYSNKETVKFAINGLEWNVDNLSYALGGGETASAGGVDTIEGGGDPNMSEVALMYQHITPEGYTITAYLWKAAGDGQVAIEFGDDLHEFGYNFTALLATTNWAGESLAVKKKLYKVVRDTA